MDLKTHPDFAPLPTLINVIPNIDKLLITSSSSSAPSSSSDPHHQPLPSTSSSSSAPSSSASSASSSSSSSSTSPTSRIVSVENDANIQVIMKLCLYILNLRYPNPEKGLASFRNDIIIPASVRTSRILDSDLLKCSIASVIDAHISLIKHKMSALTMNNSSPVEVLKAYCEEWRLFRIARLVFEMTLFNSFRDPGPRNGVSSISSTASSEKNIKEKISNFCYFRWKLALMDPLRSTLQPAIHTIMNKYREETISGIQSSDDMRLIKSMVGSYLELSKDIYTADWEKPFLENTLEFYTRVCTAHIAQNSVTAYIALCSTILDLEDDVGRNFIDVDTRPKHSDLINNAVIISHQVRLREAISGYVDNNDTLNLSVLYRIFERIGELDAMADIFIGYVSEEFDKHFASIKELENAVKSKTHEMKEDEFRKVVHSKYCVGFLERYYLFVDTTRGAFQNNIRFTTSLDRVAREKLNNNVLFSFDDPTETVAKFVAKYSDTVVSDPKDDYLTITTDRMKMEGVIVLFTFIASKDVFCKTYRIFFMGRLLRGGFINRDVETAMINRMRGIFDTQFAQQLNVMLRDIDQSRERYSPEALGMSVSDVPCAPTILTGSSWPIAPAEQNLLLTLPPLLSSLSDAYCKAFAARTDGKEIGWLHERSSGVLQMRTDKPYQVTMNHLQLSIMLLIGDAPGGMINSASIGSALQLPDIWIKAALTSLESATKLIQFNPKTSRYRINPSFKTPQVKLNAAVRFVRPVKELEVDPQVEEERELKTQAAIVRIMKARRVLDHQDLIEEVTKQTSRFFPQGAERIRRQIEKLINGNEKFIERVDAKTYKYVTEE